MGKKKKHPLGFKKHEIILNELHNMAERNDSYCMINSCEPTPYMDGNNKAIADLIKFIKKL